MVWGPAQVETDHTNKPFFFGEAKYLLDQTIAQDAGRTAVFEPNTLSFKEPVSGDWYPLTDVGEFVNAKMVCGALGTNAAGFAAVNDGEFSIDIDGVTIDVIGCNWTGVTALSEVPDTINAVAAGRFEAIYDIATDAIIFVSPTKTALASVSVLSDVGGSGTDVSGAGFLNGLTTVGTVSASTGGQVPSGIYRGVEIAAADIVAADVTSNEFYVGGPITIVEDQLVIENSLTLDSVIAATGTTIRAELYKLGIYSSPAVDIHEHV